MNALKPERLAVLRLGALATQAEAMTLLVERDRLAAEVEALRRIVTRARDSWPRWPISVTQRDLDDALRARAGGDDEV